MSGNSEDVEGEQPPARNDTLSHILYVQENLGDDKKDSTIIDVMYDQFKQENAGTIHANPAISSIGPSRIKQVVIGPRHIGLLLDDGGVCRIAYQLLQIKSGEVKEAETSHSTETSRLQEVYARAGGGEVEVIPLSGGLSSIRAATGQAKYRRVMLTNRAYYRLRGGIGDARSYILGAPRPPAANVPEDLINQVQQVLQGKSREVITRELQRTGLNVNEAVNNLLSRDDGDDQDIDMNGEHLIPEELLQILEGGVPPGTSSGVSSIAESFLERGFAEERLLDSLSARGAELRYHFGNSTASSSSTRKAKTNEKEKKKKEPETNNWRNCMHLEEDVEWWTGNSGEGIPLHALNDAEVQCQEGKMSPVVSITATSFAMYALHKNGMVYPWAWNETVGQLYPLQIVKNAKVPNASVIGSAEDPVVQMSSSNLRITVITQIGHVVTWLDESATGSRASMATEVVSKIPVESVLKVQDLVTSDHLSAFRIENIIHWCGIVPLLESTRSYEKSKQEKADKKKHVSFGETTVSTTPSTSTIEFAVGQNVQMKKAPLYPAGSVALKICVTNPVIGVLLEDCWNATDHRRFRCMTPSEYDFELEVKGFESSLYSSSSAEPGTPVEAVPFPELNRKRPHGSEGDEQFQVPPPEFGRQKIEVWNVDDLIWIHEHRKRDLMNVQLVDNNLVAVRYLPNTGHTSPFQSVFSDRLELDGMPQSVNPVVSHADSDNMRLLRKEDLQIVDKCPPRAPAILQKELLKFDVDSNRVIVSMVADLNELRVLARSKHSERAMHLYRVSTTGRVISRRRVPVFLPSVERPIPDSSGPKLISFGDPRTLFLRDTAGQLIPLQRDALNGFREPPAMHSQPILHIATACRPISLGSSEKARWQGSVMIIPGINRPWHARYIQDGSPLMQMVLYCDLEGVIQFLDRMQEMRMNNIITHYEFRKTMNEQLFIISSDLCSNVLHAAIRLTGSLKNADNCDNQHPDTHYPELFATRHEIRQKHETGMEDESTQVHQVDEPGTSLPVYVDEMDDVEEEGRWSRVLRSRPNRGPVTPLKKRKTRRATSEDVEESPDNNLAGGRSELTGMPFGSTRSQAGKQRAAMQIVEVLLSHPAMFYDTDGGEDVAYENEERLSALRALLIGRDLNGYTPFQSAVNQKAYGAAHSVWRALLQLDFRRMTDEEKMKYILPSFSNDDSANADDSPLFILCYNDVCSFTWTGEDHINQDIYECKTCGLTGSLCCCSECALTCHRNHDCRLKRTSPTAYCDCWEKSSCKALIEGNENIREYLLVQLLTHTRLYEYANARNEHVILFLARTVIRQTREQTFSQKRRGRYRHVIPPSSTVSGTPEHNLQPPKFAKTALEHCCKNPSIVIDSLKCGTGKQVTHVSPSRLHFVLQGTASHIDKLTFALSNKHLLRYSTMYISTLRTLLSGPTQELHWDQDIENWVGRFVRSLVRVLTLAINVSPLAPSTILAGEEPMEEPKDPREEMRNRMNNQGSYTMFHALVLHKKESSKLSEKSASFVAMVNRIMQILQQLPTFAVVQLAIAADAVFEPVRDGMLKPMVNPALAGSTNDPIDILEKYFVSDLSFLEVLKRSKREEKLVANAAEKKRIRRNRRDTDKDNGSDNRESMEDDRSAGDRVSESQETVRARQDSVATSTVATPRRRRLLSGNTTSDTNEDNEERTGQQREAEAESSSSDDDDDDGEEDGEEDDDDDDDDNDNDDDDDDSDRPGEDRPEGEERDDDDGEQEEDNEGIHIEEMRRNDADELAAIVEDAVPMVQLGDREEEGDWDPYQGGSPRQRDFDDNSSDSQEGGAREPQIPAENQHAENGENAGGGNIARPVAERATSRTRQRLGIREAPFGTRRNGDPSNQSRIDRFLPYRLPPRREEANSRRDDSTNSSSNNAASSSAGGSDQAPSGSSAAPSSSSTSQNRTQSTSSSGNATSNNSEAPPPPPPKKSPEHTDQPSLETAREQLALTFSVLVRAGCDILSKMNRPVMAVYTQADDNARRSQLKAQKIFGDILQETFRWMGRVFESTEARINFNETYEKALYRPVSPGPEDKKGRKEALSYIHSLLRLATDEGQDALANVEVDLLYPVGFVADAYFHFMNCLVEKPIELKQIVDTYEDTQRRHFREKCECTDMDLMVGFFMRPASLSWPGHLHDGAWDTLTGRYHSDRALKFEEECPMVGSHKVLTMTSKAEEMFREPNLDDVKRKVSSYINDPVEEYTYNILERPFEYRCPGASLAIVPHRRKQEQEFISITRDFYHHRRTPDDEIRNYSTDPERFPGYVGKADDSVSRFKDKLLLHSCEREQLFFSKWHKTLSIIGGRFYDRLAEALGTDVAFERSILLRKLASFETKYQLFNKATEKLRAQHSTTKEIILDVRREPGGLFRDTMVQLHSLYAKRMTSVRSLETPLAGTKLRVHFIDEPGEGSGVTRSFYTAFAECCMGDVAPFAPETTHEKSMLIQSVLPPKKDVEQGTDAFRRARREQAIRLKNHIRRLKTFPINLNAPRFDIKEYTGDNNWTSAVLRDNSRESKPKTPNNWGDNEGILRKIHTITSGFLTDEKIIGRVMGIMCQLPRETFVIAVNNDDTMRLHIQLILAELRAEGELDDSKSLPLANIQTRTDDETFSVLVGTDDPMDKLFEKAPYGDCYVPTIGNGAPMRIAAYRTVGRIMGICLAQGDIFPMRFSRHVFSFILKEPICWLDLGFYDPTLFNNLRLLIHSDLQNEENDFTVYEGKSGNNSQLVSLKPNGEKITVNKDNVVEFVYKYAERVLVGKRISALEAIREGILDVIPECILEGLTPEDLRLIICGIESVSISVLQANTTFLDESRASTETLNRFKQWFWQVIEAFTPQEKQDLVFFWTGSPSLPATGKWQSSASVMLRPQEDIFLPTANTCISRIYVPVYSSKRILRSKLLVAIKAKNFGFV